MAAAAALGPFFRVDERLGQGWTSWAALNADGEVLRRRAAEVRAVLAAGPGRPAPEPAVVASLTHLGLVARLVSPLLGAALLHGLLPVAPVEHVYVRLAGANPLPLALLPSSAAVVGSPAELVPAFHRFWLTPAVEPLTLALRASIPISRQVLDGNVTSAVAGALRMAATARPGLTSRAGEVLDELLSGPFAEAGHRRDDGSYVRRSCCLLYRLPGARTCGDCVLGERR
ncbi:(2Fe-2S)-binding protein [Geodermatophilus chilensis]|uniref:(2Fe-2S)-binding protein n=1 Tax=Geodermatophilus chilensis TaxID=2035835 RepID=UPI001E5C1520|nr:(2Fe-2S)-binding protein [Geodermatophilus chilensis]